MVLVLVREPNRPESRGEAREARRLCLPPGPPRVRLAMSDGIFGCHSGGWGATGLSWGEIRDTILHPTRHRAATHLGEGCNPSSLNYQEKLS